MMEAITAEHTDISSAGDALDLVIKLGGAAITDKAAYQTLRAEQLRQGAALVRLCYSAGLKLAVVHGAGSFGHFHAKEYKLNDGLKDGNYSGFCETRNSVSKLNGYVVESLLEYGVPAVACPAFPSWQTCDGVLTQYPQEVIRSVLKTSMIPVFHGDVVLDSQRGYCVLSGDTIIQTLCRDISVRRVVFLTDVLGVYDRPPSEHKAQLLHTVQLSEGKVCGDVKLSEGKVCGDVKLSEGKVCGDVKLSEGKVCGDVELSEGKVCDVKLSASTNDVTGGMLKKISSAHDIVITSEKTRVFIAKVGSQDAEKLCLERDIDIKKLAATEIVKQS